MRSREGCGVQAVCGRIPCCRSSSASNGTGGRQPDDGRVEWPLDLFRRGPRVAVADREVEAVEQSVADRARMLVADVRVKYGEVAAAIRALAIADELAVSAERDLELRRSRVAEGASPPLERDMLESSTAGSNPSVYSRREAWKRDDRVEASAWLIRAKRRSVSVTQSRRSSQQESAALSLGGNGSNGLTCAKRTPACSSLARDRTRAQRRTIRHESVRLLHANGGRISAAGRSIRTAYWSLFRARSAISLAVQRSRCRCATATRVRLRLRVQSVQAPKHDSTPCGSRQMRKSPPRRRRMRERARRCRSSRGRCGCRGRTSMSSVRPTSSDGGPLSKCLPNSADISSSRRLQRDLADHIRGARHAAASARRSAMTGESRLQFRPAIVIVGQ